MSSEKYWGLVRALVQSGQEQRIPKERIAERIANAVWTAFQDGEEWAVDVLLRWAREGAARDYTKTYKDMETVTYIRADGRRVRKTVAYSRPMRQKSDGAIIGRQLQAWWGMGRAAILELRSELAGQDEQLRDIIAMLDRIVAAMDRHPEFDTAAEAWQADGHALDEIDLGDVA